MCDTLSGHFLVSVHPGESPRILLTAKDQGLRPYGENIAKINRKPTVLYINVCCIRKELSLYGNLCLRVVKDPNSFGPGLPIFPFDLCLKMFRSITFFIWKSRALPYHSDGRIGLLPV